jgi:hypothetical protein
VAPELKMNGRSGRFMAAGEAEYVTGESSGPQSTEAK